MSAPQFIEKGLEKLSTPRRRDWIVLPALGLLTVVVLVASTQLIAYWVFPAFGDMKTCVVVNDRSTGVRGIPNCVTREKIPEGQPHEYRFNNCGDYTEIPCGPKPTGSYRIALTGTSFAVGEGVPREETFAVLLAKELSHRTGRNVQIYNKSLPRKSPRVEAMQFNQMLAAQPDLILWFLNYGDIQLASLVVPSDYAPESAVRASPRGGAEAAQPRFPTWGTIRATAESSAFAHFVNNAWKQSRSYVLLTHFIAANESQDQFVKMNNRTNESQYLDAHPSEARLMHLKEFENYFAEIMDHAKAAGIPLLVTLAPTRLQAAMISSGEWPLDIDPFNLDDELRSIIMNHGGIYIDILRDLRGIPNAEQGYFPANGHFNSRGHSMISNLLANKLTRSGVLGHGLLRGPQPQ